MHRMSPGWNRPLWALRADAPVGAGRPLAGGPPGWLSVSVAGGRFSGLLGPGAISVGPRYTLVWCCPSWILN